VEDGDNVKQGDIIFRWDPYSNVILTHTDGKIEFVDIKDGISVREETDVATGLRQRVIIEDKDKALSPHINIKDKKGKRVGHHNIPVRAHLFVHHGDKVKAGDMLAKIPREITKTRDITGGLPRVAELFEARKPKDPAVVSEIDGEVKFGKVVRGSREVIVVGENDESTYLIPYGKHLHVHDGDRVLAGDRLSEGSINPHDILRIKGVNEVQEYLVNEIQEVYRLQGVRINDKHIEVIVRQMLQKIKVEDPGDTTFLEGEQVDKFRFQEENEKVIAEGGEPATFQPLLLGITKASLLTDSFISAASFQETTRVLTEAAIHGKRDPLRGLKENVIIGHLIPAGTGLDRYSHVKVEHEEEDVNGEEETVVQAAN
jgi:DNA-directed RNA polymerase subunit beta'